ncbi:MAG: ATP-binding protein [Pseudomonadales bacterium]|nr:ATP-binding protein [Pseudomonadales bacterium]
MIKLAINQNRLVQNLRYAFTDKATVIAELMQNARRAGSPWVDISFDDTEKTLTIRDQGCGIADFQQILTLAQSEWSEGVQDEEFPFGMGFFSALFAANEVEIISRNRKVSFKTEHALAFGEINDEPMDIVNLAIKKGTVIRLFGVELTCTEVEYAVLKYAKGFPIPVYFQGQLIDRPRAVNADFIESDIGLVRLAKNTNILCYLQGMPISSSPNNFHVNGNVVHLSSIFKGRMPDRDTLVNQTDEEKKIKEAVRQLWRNKLLSLKMEMNEVEFANAYWRLAGDWNIRDVFNDHSYLPAEILSCYDETPRFVGCVTNSYMIRSNHGVSKTQVESGEIVLCYGSPEYDDEVFWSAATLAKRLNWIYVDPSLLSEGHWALSHIVDLSSLPVDVDYIPIADVKFMGLQVWTNVVLCQSYTLTSGKYSVVVDDESVFVRGNKLLTPENSKGVESLRQIDHYICNDDFDHASHDEDTGLLICLVNAERRKLVGGSQVDTMQNVLMTGHLNSLGCLAESVFITRIDENLNAEIIQICEDDLNHFNQFLETLSSSRRFSSSSSDGLIQPS